MPRPRKQPVIDDPPDPLVMGISEVLFNWTCAVRGCHPRHHLQEAKELIAKLKSLGYRIEEGES